MKRNDADDQVVELADDEPVDDEQSDAQSDEQSERRLSTPLLIALVLLLPPVGAVLGHLESGRARRAVPPRPVPARAKHAIWIGWLLTVVLVFAGALALGYAQHLDEEAAQQREAALLDEQLAAEDERIAADSPSAGLVSAELCTGLAGVLALSPATGIVVDPADATAALVAEYSAYAELAGPNQALAAEYAAHLAAFDSFSEEEKIDMGERQLAALEADSAACLPQLRAAQ